MSLIPGKSSNSFFRDVQKFHKLWTKMRNYESKLIRTRILKKIRYYGQAAKVGLYNVTWKIETQLGERKKTLFRDICPGFPEEPSDPGIPNNPQALSFSLSLRRIFHPQTRNILRKDHKHTNLTRILFYHFLTLSNIRELFCNRSTVLYRVAMESLNRHNCHPSRRL